MAAQQLEERTVGREMAIAMIRTTMKHVIGMVATVVVFTGITTGTGPHTVM